MNEKERREKAVQDMTRYLIDAQNSAQAAQELLLELLPLFAMNEKDGAENMIREYVKQLDNITLKLGIMWNDVGDRRRAELLDYMGRNHKPDMPVELKKTKKYIPVVDLER